MDDLEEVCGELLLWEMMKDEFRGGNLRDWVGNGFWWNVWG